MCKSDVFACNTMDNAILIWQLFSKDGFNCTVDKEGLSCTPCGIGTYGDTVHGECLPCPIGIYK